MSNRKKEKKMAKKMMEGGKGFTFVCDLTPGDEVPSIILSCSSFKLILL